MIYWTIVAFPPSRFENITQFVVGFEYLCISKNGLYGRKTQETA